jgi:hypothetical protein
MTMRNPLILATALTAALAAPLAFAQDANASATAQEHAAAQAASTTTPAVPATTPAADAGAMAATPATPATPPTGDTTATGATPATPATPSTAATGKKVSWSELDGDKDGKLSKSEAAPISSLSQVFDQADSDKDGALTADEYKAYIAAQGNHAGHGNNG